MKKLWSAIGAMKIQHFLFLLLLCHITLVAVLFFSMASMEKMLDKEIYRISGEIVETRAALTP